MKKYFRYVWLFLTFGGVLFIFHNINKYPTEIGYIFGWNTRYTNILISKWRLPTYSETATAYNPPFFYLISGLFARLVSQITNLSFIDSIKFWPYIGASLAMVGLYLWFKIIAKLHPTNKFLAFFCIVWIFSLPVFQKMMPMYTIEPFLLFTMALVFWYFIIIFQPKPTLKKTIILSILTSINILSRLSSLILPPTIIFGILGLGLLKRISWKKVLSFLAIFIIATITTSGWFYYVKRNEKIVNSAGAGKMQNSTFSKYGLSFHIDIPFRHMMTYPLRLPPENLNFLIPVYYSTFWGDYWNYYTQSRFNISSDVLRNDRYIVNTQRIKSLSLQNQVNLIPTLLLLSGLFYHLIQVFKKIPNKLNDKWLTQSMFLIFFSLTWLGFLYFITFHSSWKNDGIKACYMLFSIPIFIYMATVLLLKKIRKNKIIFIPIIIWLILATSINLWWSWY